MMKYRIGSCQRCGSETRIAKVWQRSDGSVLRRRRCDQCDDQWTTVEKPLGMAQNAICATDLAVLFEELGIRIDLDR